MNQCGTSSGDRGAFDRYHRRVGLITAANRAVLIIGVATVLLGIIAAIDPGIRPAAVTPGSTAQRLETGSLTSDPASNPSSALVGPAPTAAASPDAAPHPVVSPAPQPEGSPVWTPRSPVVFAPVADSLLVDAGGWDIPITLAGHQAEVDQCVWVRMDLNAAAPIVGAHNNCGGEIVLEMQEGDRVTLSGFGLDGDFLVTGSRDAFAGDVASVATEGMVADVLLQTCYYTADDRMRLVSLAATSPSAVGTTPSVG